MLPFYLILIVCVLIGCLHLKNTFRIRKMTTSFRQQKSYPIIGHTLDFIATPDKIFQTAVRLIAELQPIGVLWSIQKAFICLSSAKDFEWVLSSKILINKDPLYSFLNPYIGIIAASGDEWSKKRKWFAPVFRYQSIKEYIPIFNSNALILIDLLKNEVDKPGFNICSYVGPFALDSVGESTLGVQFKSQMDPQLMVNEKIEELAQSVVQRFFRPWLIIGWMFNLSEEGRTFNKTKKDMEEALLDIIRTRRQGILENMTEEEKMNSDVQGKGTRLTFLDALLQGDQIGDDPLTDNEIMYEATAMIVTGYQTLTRAISFTLYSLMKNEDVQEKAIKELDEIFGESDRMPTTNDILRMEYLDKVIKEALRMWPLAPFILRSVTEDTPFRDGTVLPKGSTLLLSIYNLHHNPKEFPDPEVFDPERFSKENVEKRNPFAYCPFSGGLRSCSGQKYAHLQMKVVISTILRHFRILPPVGLPDINLTFIVILMSNTGVNIRLASR